MSTSESINGDSNRATTASEGDASVIMRNRVLLIPCMNQRFVDQTESERKWID